MVKEYLSHHHLPFKEVNVFRDPGSIDEMLHYTGSFTAPLLRIGREFVQGYHPAAIERLLAQTGWLDS
ncbi:glutaredoxin family protein [Sulfoacidibacillus thermotolerans]|uniref:Glutaredoxin domain-containing protein n=1 Tax=Sulfoacidibacillus thermotolerans TaxID=1765684 RepID=A0A2U3DBQ9_SULT2|nr:glutaredoxin family protein [Sulfoacidibacillus thermotolerans]PWI58716.1 hypothetical protein BM613_01050 [Sulfoacidibacillus thermotolerans]